jgi:hypothetical protein
VRYSVEIEETRRGFVEVERSDGESLSHLRERTKEDVEDGLLLPVWEEDEIEIAADPARGLRCYDLDKPCQLKPGWPTSYCGTHDEPMLDDQEVCQRRIDDLAQQEDANQVRLW